MPARLLTLLLCTANVVVAFALNVPLIVSGYEDWVGVLRDPDASAASRQFTLYSAIARDAIGFGVSAASTIFAWEQWKRRTPQFGRLVAVLALLLSGPIIYVATH